MLRSFCPRGPLIGLDIGSQAVKLAQLKSKNGKWRLQYYGVKSLPFPAGEKTQGNSELAIEEAIKELHREGRLHQIRVACSIRGPSVMVKSIQVPFMTASELEEHFKWEMDRYIRLDARDIHWDYHIQKQDHPESSEVMMSVLLVAVKKEAVYKRVRLIERAGLKPVIVDVDALALSNMFTFNYEGVNPEGILLIHVSPSGVGMTVMNQGNPIYFREVAVGGDRYRDLMEHTVKHPLDDRLSVDATDRADSSDMRLSEVYKEISNEVKKTIEYCCDMDPPFHTQKLFLGGGYARTAGLAKTIEVEVNLPLEFIDPLKKFDSLSNLKGRDRFRGFDLLAGVAIGLALRGIDD